MRSIVIIAIAFVLFIPISAYAGLQVSGTTISGSSDSGIVNLAISNSDGKRIWEKSISFNEIFEITMPRLEEGRYTLSMKHGAIGGEQEVKEFRYTGPAPIGSFEVTIELPDSSAEDFSSFATKNRINNFERLVDFIRDSGESERRLEVIILEIGQNTSVSGQDVNAVTRFTPDGLETLEYGIAWTTMRAYGDIVGDARQILELMEDGMSLETAIDFLGIIPEVQEKLNEIEKITTENDYSPTQREWITSGPFQIDRSEYAIGEKIFLSISGLDIREKGEIAVMRPLDSTQYSEYITIPFDGAQKSAFNYYIEPQISADRGIYSIEDLVGEWKIIFRETNYQNLKFEITEEIVPGTNTEPEPKELRVASFVDKSKDPQHYIDRYLNEEIYRDWFDENYPDYTIYEAVGIEEPKKERVPSWIKNNAKWWSENQIDDDTFVNGIQFLITEKIVNIPTLPPQASETAQENVPSWVKNNAKWWSEGLISEDDFVKGIEYLVSNGIIRVGDDEKTEDISFNFDSSKEKILNNLIQTGRSNSFSISFDADKSADGNQFHTYKVIHDNDGWIGDMSFYYGKSDSLWHPSKFDNIFQLKIFLSNENGISPTTESKPILKIILKEFENELNSLGISESPSNWIETCNNYRLILNS